MKFGAMESVLGTTVPEAFRRAAEAGLDGVEIEWGAPAEARPGGRLGPERRAALRAAARAAGVEIPSVCAGFLNKLGGLAHSDTQRRRVGLDAVHDGVQLCSDLGARVLLLPFFEHGRIADRQGVDLLVAHLRMLVGEAEQHGVILGIEHTLPAAEASALIEQVHSPWVRAYWDMANAACLGYDPIEELHVLAPVLAQVHAKEYDGGDGPPATREAPRFDGLNVRPLGSGSVPLAKVLATLQRQDYERYIVLETATFGEPVASVRADLGQLRMALA